MVACPGKSAALRFSCGGSISGRFRRQTLQPQLGSRQFNQEYAFDASTKRDVLPLRHAPRNPPFNRGQPTSVRKKVLDAVSQAFQDFPAVVTIVLYLFLTGVTTMLLVLPAASSSGSPTPLADSSLTAASAIGVAGLSTLDMATHWSGFGHLVIFVAMQIGGLGVVTLATLLAVLASERLGRAMRNSFLGDYDPSYSEKNPRNSSLGVTVADIGALLRVVVLSALVIQAVLTVFLVPILWRTGLDVWDGLWRGAYLATSAFTNTGFNPLVGGMAGLSDDPLFLLVLTAGSFLGSVGFSVIFVLSRALRTYFERRRKRTIRRPRIGLHAQLTLTMSIGLLLAGAVVISALEWQNEATLGNQSAWMKPISAVFLSMMARSTGLNSIPTEELSSASLLILDFLMFVGGGSASTAGGIKVTTLAVLLLAVYAQARGNQDITVFERRIPSEIVRLAVTVTLWGATIVATTTILLMAITPAPLEKALFESISAFASCGLSAGFTNAELPAAAKFILAATIVIGRLGTITFASALVGRRRTKLFRRASERPILG